jgi:hypothetical protein
MGEALARPFSAFSLTRRLPRYAIRHKAAGTSALFAFEHVIDDHGSRIAGLCAGWAPAEHLGPAPPSQGDSGPSAHRRGTPQPSQRATPPKRPGEKIAATRVDTRHLFPLLRLRFCVVRAGQRRRGSFYLSRPDDRLGRGDLWCFVKA